MRAALVLIAAFAATLVLDRNRGTALAHDSWISRGAFRNAAGEWCCGAGDCFEVPEDAVRIVARGYLIFVPGLDLRIGAELVPYAEAQPSPDGSYWRCKRPDGSRRCFFAPPPSM
jgi:hypothetical protein